MTEWFLAKRLKTATEAGIHADSGRIAGAEKDARKYITGLQDFICSAHSSNPQATVFAPRVNKFS
ncbi:MAG: hypothetical protein R6V61_01295 [Wenzhouxiangellaceae bacterium]